MRTSILGIALGIAGAQPVAVRGRTNIRLRYLCPYGMTCGMRSRGTVGINLTTFSSPAASTCARNWSA